MLYSHYAILYPSISALNTVPDYVFVWRLLQETENSQRSRPVSAFCFGVSHSAGHAAWHIERSGAVYVEWRHLCVIWVSQVSEQVSEQLFSTSLSTVPFLPSLFFGHKHTGNIINKISIYDVTKYIEIKVYQKHLHGMSSTELTELSVNWFSPYSVKIVFMDVRLGVV